MKDAEKKFGVFVGRFCPPHLGHEAVISRMIEVCAGHCLIMIGSANAPLSLRHFFSYRERRELLKKLFPMIKIVGLPDYNSDAEWMLALDDIVSLVGADPRQVVFFGGCEEDVRFFFEFRRECELLNRFDGTTPRVSATEVRDALIHDRPLNALVNPVITDEVKALFAIKWDKFRKM